MPQAWQTWVPWGIDAWCGSAVVQDMTDAEYRAYHNLLMAQFQTEDGMLPDDEKELARISRKRSEWPAIREIVLEQFESNGNGRIFNARMKAHWEEAQRLFFKRQHGGKATAKKRWSSSVDAVQEESGSTPIAVLRENIAEQPLITVQDSTGHKEQKHSAARVGFVLPDWVDATTWQAYEESRQKARHPLTDHARLLLVRKLESLKRAGHDPTCVMETAIERGWRGFFAPEQQGDGNGAHRQREKRRSVTGYSAAEQRAADNRARIDRAYGRASGTGGDASDDRPDDGELLQPDAGRWPGRTVEASLDGNRAPPGSARAA